MFITCRSLFLGFLLLASGACMKQEPVKYFLIHNAAGVTEVTDADVATARAALDAFALRYKMEKVKPGEAGIIRYYQPNAYYEIGFYAKRFSNGIAVYATPLSTVESSRDSYKAFRQNLANALSVAFPGRVTLEL